jgi:hypothetical protein
LRAISRWNLIDDNFTQRRCLSLGGPQMFYLIG